MEKIIDGKKIADLISDNLKNKINELNSKLKLVVLQVGNNLASNIYINKKKQLCEKMNIEFEIKKYENITTEKLIKEIEALNNDKNVTGVLVQLPLPKELDETRIIESIDYKKDVDGLTSKNIGYLYTKQEGIIPCTAFGILKIFEYQNISLTGKNIVIIGRTKLVGIPLMPLLLQKDATITICHSKTKNLDEKTKTADILIVAAGHKDLINKEMIKENVIIIDVGINRTDDKICGDVNNNVLDKCQYLTPVPGGVGPLTVIMLINNIIECYNLQNK